MLCMVKYCTNAVDTYVFGKMICPIYRMMVYIRLYVISTNLCMYRTYIYGHISQRKNKILLLGTDIAIGRYFENMLRVNIMPKSADIMRCTIS